MEEGTTRSKKNAHVETNARQTSRAKVPTAWGTMSCRRFKTPGQTVQTGTETQRWRANLQHIAHAARGMVLNMGMNEGVLAPNRGRMVKFNELKAERGLDWPYCTTGDIEKTMLTWRNTHGSAVTLLQQYELDWIRTATRLMTKIARRRLTENSGPVFNNEAEAIGEMGRARSEVELMDALELSEDGEIINFQTVVRSVDSTIPVRQLRRRTMRDEETSNDWDEEVKRPKENEEVRMLARNQRRDAKQKWERNPPNVFFTTWEEENGRDHYGEVRHFTVTNAQGGNKTRYAMEAEINVTRHFQHDGEDLCWSQTSTIVVARIGKFDLPLKITMGTYDKSHHYITTTFAMCTRIRPQGRQKPPQQEWKHPTTASVSNRLNKHMGPARKDTKGGTKRQEQELNKRRADVKMEEATKRQRGEEDAHHQRDGKEQCEDEYTFEKVQLDIFQELCLRERDLEEAVKRRKWSTNRKFKTELFASTVNAKQLSASMSGEDIERTVMTNAIITIVIHDGHTLCLWGRYGNAISRWYVNENGEMNLVGTFDEAEIRREARAIAGRQDCDGVEMWVMYGKTEPQIIETRVRPLQPVLNDVAFSDSLSAGEDSGNHIPETKATPLVGERKSAATEEVVNLVDEQIQAGSFALELAQESLWKPDWALLRKEVGEEIDPLDTKRCGLRLDDDRLWTPQYFNIQTAQAAYRGDMLDLKQWWSVDPPAGRGPTHEDMRMYLENFMQARLHMLRERSYPDLSVHMKGHWSWGEWSPIRQPALHSLGSYPRGMTPVVQEVVVYNPPPVRRLRLRQGPTANPPAVTPTQRPTDRTR